MPYDKSIESHALITTEDNFAVGGDVESRHVMAWQMLSGAVGLTGSVYSPHLAGVAPGPPTAKLFDHIKKED